jgi:hypothetical protein
MQGRSELRLGRPVHIKGSDPMIPEAYWFLLAFFAFLALVGIESKLGKIADELTILRKRR